MVRSKCSHNTTILQSISISSCLQEKWTEVHEEYPVISTCTKNSVALTVTYEVLRTDNVYNTTECPSGNFHYTERIIHVRLWRQTTAPAVVCSPAAVRRRGKPWCSRRSPPAQDAARLGLYAKFLRDLFRSEANFSSEPNPKVTLEQCKAY